MFQQQQHDPVPEQSCYKQQNNRDRPKAKQNVMDDPMKDTTVPDAGSSFSSMFNKELLTEVYNSKDLMQMNTNAGSRILSKRGPMLGLEHVPWHDEESRANVWQL